MNTTETKATHTPGPWTWQRQPHRFRLLSARGEETGLAVAVLSSEDEMFPGSANARLIAASPELLTALKDCAESMRVLIASNRMDPDENETLGHARAAIARAEGRAL